MSGWKIAQLDEIADVTIGRQRSPKYADGPQMAPYVRAQNVTDGRLDLDSVLTMNFDQSERRRYRLEFGDVLVTEGCGSPNLLGASCIWRGEIEGFVGFQNHVLRVRHRPGESDPFFLYGLCRWLHHSGRWQETGGGTSILNIGLGRAKNVAVPAPTFGEQTAIGFVLRAMDDLIENNRRRVELLEQMAQAIYREWFVHFRYPGHEHDELVDSPLGPIPSGWEVGSIGDAASYVNRGVAPKYDERATSIVVNQKCVRNGRLGLVQARTQSKAVPADKVIRFGDVLVNSTGVGTLGRVAQLYWDQQNATVDTHVTIVRPHRTTNLDWFGLTMLSLQPEFEAQGVGSTGQTELSRTAIAGQPMVLPPTEVQQRFGTKVHALRQMEIELSSAADRLAAIRDLLLPKLVTGQIDVSKLDLDAVLEGAGV